jgi:membrane protease YdiL (CAAX protease family)
MPHVAGPSPLDADCCGIDPEEAKRVRGRGTVVGMDDISSPGVNQSSIDARDAVPIEDLEHGGDRYSAVTQYSLAQILGVWAAAALPMAALAWIVAPWLGDQLGGSEPLARGLLICFTAGLIWQFVLVLILVRRELGSLEWARVRDALWLRSPRDPKTGRVGGKVWWWVLLFTGLFGLWTLVPGIPGPSVRDFADFIGSSRAEHFFSGAWGWFAVYVVLVVFNTVLGEELLFRGLLLPRMRAVFGKQDWVANGALFAIYHLHQPWTIPNNFVDGIFLLAYPSRRFQSAWMGIIVHSSASVFTTVVVLTLVLK